MMSSFMSRSGAVEAGGIDAGVALHYGRPAQEHRALVAGRGVVDLGHLAVVTVSGEDRLNWLTTLSSQQLNELSPGESSELLLLDPNGRIEHAAAVIEDGEQVWLITEAADAEGLVEFLDKMRFMFRVEVNDRSAERAVLGVIGDGCTTLAGADADVLIWHDPWPRTATNGTRYAVSDEEHPGSEISRCMVIVARAKLSDIVSASDLSLAGTWAWESLRVAAWRPRFGREVDERTTPHELDWLRTAVDLHKGCYRGQETIAKIINLGRPPRRLVMLHLDGSEHVVPNNGERVMNGERDVGHVTSVVRHAEDGPLALALIKRNTPAEAQLTVGDIPAAQEIIVPVAGESLARPAERPGQGLRRQRRP